MLVGFECRDRDLERYEGEVWEKQNVSINSRKRMELCLL
jgi:hypothetical protein